MGLFVKGYTLKYRTELPIRECIQNITRLPWQFSDKWGTSHLWYKCTEITDSQLMLVFTGGQFRKSKKTYFWADFIPEQRTTIVTMKFAKEQFSLPPLTHPDDIDLFMQEKINAVRVDCTYY